MPDLYNSVVILAIVIIIARYIKRGSKLLQRLFIPSSLIAGAAGLIFGPQLLGTIPAEVTDQWAQFPRHLINVVFAGLFLGKVIPSRKTIWRMSGPMIALGSTMAWGQYVIGILLAVFFLTPVFGANPLVGSLIEISFSGGHGTAAGLAPTFEQLGWPEGTDLALGLATFSIFMAVFSGIFMINIYNRRRGLLGDRHWKEREQQMIRSGYNLLAFTQKFNTNPKAIIINIVAFAASIGIGWGLLQIIIGTEELVLRGFTDIRFFTYLPLFPLAMIGGLILQLILKRFKLQHLIQQRTAQILSSIALDVLIASAIATVSIDVIGSNLPVFITLAIAGTAWIIVCFLFLAPKFFSDHWFKRGITDYGQAMGMTATGLLMNRLVDPSNRLKIRESFAYKQLAFEPLMGGGIVTATAAIVLHEAGSLITLSIALVMTLFWLIVGLKLGKRRTVIQKIWYFVKNHYT